MFVFKEPAWSRLQAPWEMAHEPPQKRTAATGAPFSEVPVPGQLQVLVWSIEAGWPGRASKGPKGLPRGPRMVHRYVEMMSKVL